MEMSVCYLEDNIKFLVRIPQPECYFLVFKNLLFQGCFVHNRIFQGGSFVHHRRWRVAPPPGHPNSYLVLLGAYIMQLLWFVVYIGDNYERHLICWW